MCMGAVDGKRVLIRKPPESGLEYFDYKSHHSVIMLALVDGNYRFIYVNVSVKASGGWDRCTFHQGIEAHMPNDPPAATLLFTNTKSP